MSQIFYRIGQAAARLGISKYHLRRLAKEGLIRHKSTRTGQLLFPDSEINRLEEEGVPPVPATAEPEDAAEEVDHEPTDDRAPSTKDELLAAPSRRVISSPEEVLASRYKVKKMRIEEDMEQTKEAPGERCAEKTALKAVQEAERQRLTEVQRDLQARAGEERKHREWVDSWVQSAINWLPYGVPEQYHLEVRRQVEEALQELHPSQSYSLASSLVRAASAKALEPFERQRETEKAVEEALGNLDISAKDFYKPTEWQIRSERDARTALRALPQGASFQEKKAAARTAVHKINAEFEHSHTCDRLVAQVSFWGGTDEERRRAKLAVEKALKALPVGSSSTEMEEVKNRTLKPFEEEVEKRKKQKEKQAQIEQRLAQSLRYIEAYLKELESEDELEFDGAQDLRNFSYELRDAIAPKVRSELERQDVSDARLRKLIEELVDEEL